MREIPARLAELDRTVPLVVMCHSGGRSSGWREFLLGNGFSKYSVSEAESTLGQRR